MGDGNLAGSTRPRLAHREELGISVRRSHWHRGIGTRLLRALLDFARDANLRIVSLTKSPRPFWLEKDIKRGARMADYHLVI
ncbi:MAG: GNAT family N-acetyltransferase [Collinsella sp.]|uniref:GNAT family N-acetyltransferase n=1 Tax=Collinsella sp. TaxID=1965294 RepID=UPI003990C79C